jgi:uncharacterized Zn finger protein
MNFYSQFPPYVPVAERRKKAQAHATKLKKQGHAVKPVVIEGRTIANSVWGKAWCNHLEAYSDYESRLPRGRTYVRNGSVIDLQLSRGKLTALVSGSSIYALEAEVAPVEPKRWKRLVAECAGQIDSVVELLSGRLSDGVMEVLCRPDTGLFPKPSEISLSCSCPDGAYLCKHLAAALYGVGARLDEAPELLFELRGVDTMDLVSAAGTGHRLGARATKPAMERTALGAVFGIELDGAEEAPKPQKRAAPRPRKSKGTSAVDAIVAQLTALAGVGPNGTSRSGIRRAAKRRGAPNGR